MPKKHLPVPLPSLPHDYLYQCPACTLWCHSLHLHIDDSGQVFGCDCCSLELSQTKRVPFQLIRREWLYVCPNCRNACSSKHLIHREGYVFGCDKCNPGKPLAVQDTLFETLWQTHPAEHEQLSTG